MASWRVVITHWSAFTPAKKSVVTPRLRRIASSGVSQKPL
jgi:hypothetical protein